MFEGLLLSTQRHRVGYSFMFTRILLSIGYSGSNIGAKFVVSIRFILSVGQLRAGGMCGRYISGPARQRDLQDLSIWQRVFVELNDA